MTATFDMQQQLRVGAEGAARVKLLLARKFGTLIDYEGNRDMQKRGIDIHIEPWGDVEIKTDLHSTLNFFLEYECAGKPSGIMTSEANYYAYYFPDLKLIYMLPVPPVRNYLEANKKWFWAKYKKVIHSSAGKRKWTACGFALPRDFICTAVPVVVYEDYHDKLWLVAGEELRRKKSGKKEIASAPRTTAQSTDEERNRGALGQGKETPS